jgi:SAM-dependent methyltransferase
MAPKASATDIAPIRFGREEPYNFDCLAELFGKSYSPPTCRTIHFGCGKGRTTVYLAQRGHRVLGIDPDRELLSAARERAVLAGVELDLMAGDPLSLPPLPGECFGLAIDFWTACTLKDGMQREEYLRRIHGFLMRNGILLASAPAPKRRGVAKRKRTSRRRPAFAFAGPFVSDITRAGFEVLFEGIREAPTGDQRLLVHARKPG